QDHDRARPRGAPHQAKRIANVLGEGEHQTISMRGGQLLKGGDAACSLRVDSYEDRSGQEIGERTDPRVQVSGAPKTSALAADAGGERAFELRPVARTHVGGMTETEQQPIERRATHRVRP